MKSKKSPLVVFVTGPAGAGKDSLLDLLEENLPPVGTLKLLMKPVIDELCIADPVFAALRASGERLPAHLVAQGFKSKLLHATLDEMIHRILCGGACRSFFEAQEYLGMLSKRRKDHDVHYISLKCPRHVCIDRDHDRGKKAIENGLEPRTDLGAAGKRWDDHVAEETEIFSVISQYSNVKVHEVNANRPKKQVLCEVWDILGFGEIRSSRELVVHN